MSIYFRDLLSSAFRAAEPAYALFSRIIIIIIIIAIPVTADRAPK